VAGQRSRGDGSDPENAHDPAFDLSADLARISAPTLVIGCTDDGMRTPAMVAKVAARIPGAKYVEAVSGHFMAVETPDLFTELAVPFLKGASTAR
jgi:3-oxoadipate enol-lactonase